MSEDNIRGGVRMIGETINWAIIAPLLVVQVILTLTALIDWIKQEHTRGPKILWLLIILFISMLGPVLYFIIGKKER